MQLDSYISYIQYELKNVQAAESVWKDAVKTIEVLKSSAGSLAYCVDKKLKKMGYRSITFNHHRYIMLYRIKEKTVFVEAVYHMLQDHENIFNDNS